MRTQLELPSRSQDGSSPTGLRGRLSPRARVHDDPEEDPMLEYGVGDSLLSRTLQKQNHQLKLVAGGSGLVAVLSIITTIVVLSRGQSRPDNLSPAPQSLTSQFYSPKLQSAYGSSAKQLILAATADPLVGKALHDRLKALCYIFGPRLSGTQALEDAINWVKEQMVSDGLANVHLEAVQGISNWRRGHEEAQLLTPRRANLTILGLGGSVGGNVTAPVLGVSSFEDLEDKKTQVAGKIVFFNVAFTSYGATVGYRYLGATAAARHGAVGMLLRSVSSASMENPHTGALAYGRGDADGVQRIPAAAVSVEHADMLQYYLDTNQSVTVRFEMGAFFLPPAASSNIVAEVQGREKPEEVVVLGGHIDSWDVGLGAMDDGAGLLVCWEAVRLIHSLGLRPKRTVRVVGWVNEESGNITGTAGSHAYAQQHLAEKHVLAIESDSGAFSPEGFYFVGGDHPLAVMQTVAATLLQPLGATAVLNGTASGADVLPLYRTQGTPALELKTNSTKYFWYHHSAADTPDKLDPKDMANCAATLAVVAYAIAEMDDPGLG